ncbi:MAG: C39 family peptidase [Streptococcaceae bacterium]|nr:C39 family peptidase [Streptococcaceae bacterium]
MQLRLKKKLIIAFAFSLLFFAHDQLQADSFYPTSEEQRYHNFYDRPFPECNVVYFSQGDPAWHDQYVGDAPFGPNGCGPTSYAMVFSSFGNLMSPLEWAKKLYDAGYYDEGIAGKSKEAATADSTPTSSVVYAASLMDLKAIPLWTQEELENFLKTSNPVLASGKFNPNSKYLHGFILQGFQNGKTFVIDPDSNYRTGYWDILNIFNIRHGKSFENDFPGSHLTNAAFYGISGRPMISAVYRLYQPRAIFTNYTYPDPIDPGRRVDNYIGLHNYTSNVYEVDQMVNNGWDYEQVAFLDKGERWLYRVYNPNDGNHLFTMNSHEKDELLSLGWRDEGVGWRVSMSGKPVYRIYNPGSGEHIYTLNYEEVKAATAAGMIDEGVAWWC